MAHQIHSEAMPAQKSLRRAHPVRRRDAAPAYTGDAMPRSYFQARLALPDKPMEWRVG
jgi:hypothetical protein